MMIDSILLHQKRVRKKEEDNSMKSNQPFKYASLAIEILVGIFFAFFAGKWLDNKFQFSFPFVTVGLSILVVFNIILNLVKEVSSKK